MGYEEGDSHNQHLRIPTRQDSVYMRFQRNDRRMAGLHRRLQKGIPHNYDIVIGAMANDQIYNYIEDFIAGVITREQFWVLAKFKYPTHQICFATETSLKCLKFVESEKLSKK